MFRILSVLAILAKVQAFDESVFVKEMHTLYNYARMAHGVPTVRMRTSLSRRSKQWADHLSSVAGDSCLRHSDAGMNSIAEVLGGENLFFFWSMFPITEHQLAKKCADAFYQEIKYYNYNRPGYIQPAAHFTEMVWKSVKEIGIAVKPRIYSKSHDGCRVMANSRRKGYGYMVVIQHNPKGNRASRSEFMLNVLRPKKFLKFA